MCYPILKGQPFKINPTTSKEIMMKNPITLSNNTNDLLKVKTKRPNHLASTTEKQLAAGFCFPSTLLERFNHCQQLTQEIQPLLIPVIGSQMALSCCVINMNANKITLTLPTFTAVNHLRNVKSACLSILKTSTRFSQITEMEVILSNSKFKNTQQNH